MKVVGAITLLPLILTLAACATAEQRAATDDKTCQSYGAKPGTDAYVQCRMFQQARRDQADSDLGDRLRAAGGALRDRPSVNCTTTPGLGGTTTTRCDKKAP
jgi:hypothetical protein